MLKVLQWWLSLIILPFASMAARYTAELHCSYGKGIYQDVRLHSSDWLIQRIVTLCYGKGWVSFYIFARRPLMFHRSPRAFAPHHSGLINANVGAAVRLALSRLQLKCSSDGWAASERPSSYTFLTSELLPTFLTKYLLFLFFFFLYRRNDSCTKMSLYLNLFDIQRHRKAKLKSQSFAQIIEENTILTLPRLGVQLALGGPPVLKIYALVMLHGTLGKSSRQMACY